MVFATGTVPNSTAFPARDFMNALQAPLTTAGYSLVDQIGTPTSGTWRLGSGLYGNGSYVGVCFGTATAVWSSDNGATFTRRDLPVMANWNAVAFGNNTFVAIASSTIHAVYSTNGGDSWSLCSLPSADSWSLLAYGNGVFVALPSSSNGVYATSTDGINWTQRTMLGASYTALGFGAGVFVATAGTSVYTSTDGITWIARGAVLPGACGSIAFGAGVFVAMPSASTASYSTSPDGITWTTRSGLVTQVYNQVVANPSGYFALLSWSANAIYTTSTPTNGGNWAVKASIGTPTPFAIAAGPTSSSGINSRTVVFTSGSGYTTFDFAGDNQINYNQTFSNGSQPYADVYRIPASANSFGQAWHLILRRASDSASNVYYQVAEQYSSRKASQYGGTGANVTPATTTFANPAAAANADTIYGTAAFISIAAAGLPTQWWVSATGNRAVVAVRTPSAEQGFYAGLYEDLLPSGTTQFPLVCAKLPTAQNATTAIGGGSAINAGGFTREPNQTASSTQNFDAAIHNGYVVGASASIPAGYTPLTTFSALYGNAGMPARVPVGSSRSVAAMGDAVRGLLYDTVVCAMPAIIGDTISAGGKTWTRMCGPTATPTFGYFIDATL